jgi:protein phosphatase
VRFEHAIRAIQGARNYQEDAAAARPGSAGLGVVLADGMGGHAGGAVASGLASAAFLHVLASSQDVGPALVAALRDANEAIAHGAAQSPHLTGMGCTLVGVAFEAQCMDWISVGDSPLYLVRKGGIERLNEDHSFAPEIDRLAEAGRISWGAARADPYRHVLRSALTGAEIDLVDRPQVPLKLEPDDWVILASDGIHTLAEPDIARIVSAAGSADAAAEALLAAVAAVGDPHQDNTTVVAVRAAL